MFAEIKYDGERVQVCLFHNLTAESEMKCEKCSAIKYVICFRRSTKAEMIFSFSVEV